MADTTPTPKVVAKEEPAPSSNASVKVRTVFPTGSFTVEGVPTITAEGTMLTKTQLSTVEKVAPEYGVTLETEEVK